MSVPLFFQPDDYLCVPTCLKMVLDYLKNTLNDNSIPNLTIDEIAKIINTKDDGTVLEDVEGINKNEAILRAVPSLEFEIKYPNRFPSIEEEIKANIPVIAWIFISDNHRGFKHSVVITGVDIETSLIYYNDPAYGEIEEDIGKFISMWEKVDTVLIKVKIGKREQRIMPEYIKNETNEGR